MFAALSSSAAAEGAVRQRQNPYGCMDAAARLGAELSELDLHRIIDRKKVELTQAESDAGSIPNRPCAYLFVAELLKRVGSFEAELYYKKAILADPHEPALDMFYADYLRVFRGPDRPLFPSAEFHYYRARRKLCVISENSRDEEWDEQTQRRLDRAIINLYQQDGLPGVQWFRTLAEPAVFPVPPQFFLSTTQIFGSATNDIPEVDDVRDFTSEALFSQSAIRLNRELTRAELSALARSKEQYEGDYRIRIRNGPLPVIDLLLNDQTIDQAQVTNFFEPRRFNDVDVTEYGAAVFSPLNAAPFFDLFGRAAYKRIERFGLIEFLPSSGEDVDQWEFVGAASRFWGPNKVTFEFVSVFQDIAPDLPNPPDRQRRIMGGTVNVRMFGREHTLGGNIGDPFGRQFQNRGIEVFGGHLQDRELFGDVAVRKRDYFVGAAIRGFQCEPLRPVFRSFDFEVQSTVFESEVEGDPSQENSQYRTTVILLARLKDEEEEPLLPEGVDHLYPAFIHIVVPFKHDVAIDGPESFENWAVGAELSAKFFSLRLAGTTILASAGYRFQRFYKLDKNLNLWTTNVSIGF